MWMQTALLCQVFQDFKNVAEFSSKGNLIPRRIVEAFPSHIVPHLQLFLGYTLISFFKGAILPQLKKKKQTKKTNNNPRWHPDCDGSDPINSRVSLLHFSFSLFLCPSHIYPFLWNGLFLIPSCIQFLLSDLRKNLSFLLFVSLINTQWP